MAVARLDDENPDGEKAGIVVATPDSISFAPVSDIETLN